MINKVIFITIVLCFSLSLSAQVIPGASGKQYTINDVVDRSSALDVLGLQEGATKQDIKKAYRDMSKKYHPDKNQGHDELFKIILRAYETANGERKVSEFTWEKRNTVDWEQFKRDKGHRGRRTSSERAI
jgi:DnaJ-class molecular chaperone